MLDSKHHIELDGELYRLAESAEGQHYNAKLEPLRPPNGVTVQGESSQKFQPRPEVMLWNWTDWSQGEGRRSLKFGEAGRSWQLDGVRAFEEPGHLIPGYYVEITNDSGDINDFAVSVSLVVGNGKLYGLSRVNNTVYEWDGTKWDAGTTLTGYTNGCLGQAVGDEDAIYWHESWTQEIWKWTGVGAPTQISTTVTNSSRASLAQTDDYIYSYAPESADVFEVAKSGGATTLVDTWTNTGDSVNSTAWITELDGRVYLLIVTHGWTSIREITPSSAAGTGFGSEIARIHGFRAESLWAHSGSLFVAGKYRDPAIERTVLYLTPGGEYGSLGEIRQGDDIQNVSGGAGRMLDHFFVVEQLRDTEDSALFQIDALSGGIACLAYDQLGSASDTHMDSIASYEGGLFWCTQSGAGNDRVMWADPDRYGLLSSAVSSEHDFDFVDDKFLSSLVLACQPLPADWTIYVDYQLDGDGTWTNAIEYTTDSGRGTTVAITDNVTTVEFRRLQLRVRFAYTGAGVPSSAPVLLGIEARAVVAAKVNVWELLIDLSTDQSAGKQSRSGTSKAQSLRTTLNKKVAIDFKDGYESRLSGDGEYNSYDVFVDGGNVILTSPGEGIGAIILREVI